jgi:hypothetical protein
LTDIDDRAAAGLQHRRQHRLEHDEGAGQVDVDLVAPVGEAGLAQGLDHGVAGIVDEDRRQPGFGDGALEACLHRGLIGGVGDDGMEPQASVAPLLDEALQPAAVTIAGDDVGAKLGEERHQRAPDAAGGTGDDGRLTRKPDHDCASDDAGSAAMAAVASRSHCRLCGRSMPKL